jgi:hypothetical protein
MTIMRLLNIEKGKTKKDRSGNWIGMQDPTTKAFDPKHYDANCLSDDSFKWFFRQNNEIVSQAVGYGLDIEKEYALFFELGMRVSQQLEGKVRDKTSEKLNTVSKELENVLVTRAKEKFSEEERLAYKTAISQLAESGLSEEANVVRQIVENFEELQEVKKRTFFSRCLDRVDSLKRRVDLEFFEYLPKIPDECKLDYIRLMSYERIEEKSMPMRDSAKDIFAVVNLLGPVHGKEYLELLISQRKDRSVWSDLIQYMEENMKSATPDQRTAFFEVAKKDVYMAFKELR